MRALLRSVVPTLCGLLPFAVVAGSISALPAAADPGLQIFGWVERVYVQPAGLELEAKLDTGAETSSLGATGIRRIRRGTKRFVKFSVAGPRGERIELERPFLRLVRIKRHEGRSQRRPTVEIEICLGNQWQLIEVSLIDRSGFDFPLLLGRNALEDKALVDPSATMTQDPSCREIGRAN